MHQVLIRKGRVITARVPAPIVSAGGVLIRTAFSCISSGTELSSVKGSGKSLIQKAFDQPEKVRQVLKMASEQGLSSTWEKVQGKLGTPTATGYSLSGVVLAVGEGVFEFKPGDAVSAAGAGCAHHAEFVDVPQALVVKIPALLDFAEASTVALGSIAMQGTRRLNPSLGEFVVVVGVGMVGQLATQMLKLSGARVAVIDLDASRLTLARSLGAEQCVNAGVEDPVQSILQWSGGRGADAVLFCAATENPKALQQAFQMTRKKGRVVMVGIYGDVLDRSDIYEKEIDFLISTSYGPGRYDKAYEENNHDYPYAYVRWTEKRNMEEYLRLLSVKAIQATPLIQQTFSVLDAELAFAALTDPQKRPIMVLLKYEGKALPQTIVHLPAPARRGVEGKRIRVGVIGAGGFTTGIHLPNLKALHKTYQLQAVCNRTGHAAKTIATQFGAVYATSDYKKLLADPEIDLVLIGTRHKAHGSLVLECLRSGKHVFVEKPLCLNRGELSDIQSFYAEKTKAPLLMTGFNRRFSPYLTEIRKYTAKRLNPLFIRYRMNAGHIPLDHWVHSGEGGGRIIGEACHVIDLFTSLTNAKITSVHVQSLMPRTSFFSSRDNRAILVAYEDGSLASLDYFAVGSTAFPKESMEIHFDQKTLVVDDFKSLRGFGFKMKEMTSKMAEKGHKEEFEALSEALQVPDAAWPIALWDQIQTTDVTFQIEESDTDLHV